MSELDYARLFVRPVGPDAIKEDLEDIFKSFGEIVEVKIMRGYGFVEFTNEDDSKAARESLNGSDFRGQSLQIEFAKPKPSPRERDEFNSSRFGGGKRYRVLVSNLADDVSWQDLKDFAREKNVQGVNYANVSGARDGTGVIDFISKEDLEDGLAKLDGLDLKGSNIAATEDPNPPPLPSGPPPGRFRDSYGGGRGDRGGRYGDRRGGDRDYDRRGGYDRGYDRRDRYSDRGSDRGGYDRRDRGGSDRRGGYDRRGGDRRDYDRRDRDRDYDRRGGDRDRDYDRRDKRDYDRRDRDSDRRDSRGGRDDDAGYAARERSQSPPRYSNGARDRDDDVPVRDEPSNNDDGEAAGSW